MTISIKHKERDSLIVLIMVFKIIFISQTYSNLNKKTW